MASDLVAGDFNGQRDIFSVRIGSEDSDLDGLDDDWEMAFFNGLSRTGNEDTDDDQLSNMQEFIAGTDPTNQGSVLRVITFTIGNRIQGTWKAIVGKEYRVQYTDEISAATWRDLGGTRAAESTLETFVDELSSDKAKRFYRVVALP
jgi:hypothetical protein